MLENFTWVHMAWMAAAVVLEVVANLFIKASKGFTRRTLGLAGILSAVFSFVCLSMAVQGIALSVAYAIWGGCGVVATAVLGYTLFKQRVKLIGWIGIATIVAGMATLKLS
ncbi:multidrug/spermidine efflux SMR transporter subunit MdtI [Pseudomonas batumici]|uniref:multidrug/spermidine efflux SMR transporter subunit MdtI n=1 Tax=Pseudomonas batumici TaxID=226910 RepID=UPI0030CC8EAB